MRILFGLLGVLLLLLCAAVAMLPRAALPESSWTMQVSLWRRFGLRIGVPSAIRFATSPLGARLLDGHSVATRYGRISVARGPEGVRLRCAPCTILVPAVSREPLVFAAVDLDVVRRGQMLTGMAHIGQVAVRIEGTLTDSHLAGKFELGDTPVRDIYALFAPAIPELKRARITGQLAVKGTFSLPDGSLTFAPRLHGFAVGGLNTERLAYGRVVHVCRASDGTSRLRAIGEGGSDWIPMKALGKLLPRAVIASEDARYFRHPGYDLVEALDALEANVNADAIVRGGSTLTQQLARNLFLGQERTLVRKLRETLYAVEMERTLGKERILALYLNTVDWGPGVCGAWEAARTYFGKPPARLRAEEAAWLASILRNPHAAWRDEYGAGQVKARRVAWVVYRMPGLRRAERVAALRRPLCFRGPSAGPASELKPGATAHHSVACKAAQSGRPDLR